MVTLFNSCTDSKGAQKFNRTTVRRIINSTTRKYSSVAFTEVVYSLGFHPQTQIYLEPLVQHTAMAPQESTAQRLYFPRSQVEVEIKKRMKAEAAQDHLVRIQQIFLLPVACQALFLGCVISGYHYKRIPNILNGIGEKQNFTILSLYRTRIYR